MIYMFVCFFGYIYTRVCVCGQTSGIGYFHVFIAVSPIVLELPP